MAFPADLCARLLDADKSLVGTICSRRILHVDQIEKAVSHGLPVKQAILASHEWIVSGARPSDNGLCKVENIGFGAVLMRRDVFETMIAKKTVGRFGGQGISVLRLFRSTAARCRRSAHCRGPIILSALATRLRR
jgi:hypothetical protein